MASLCKVCQHDASVQIDTELREGATGTSVAEKYGLSQPSVSRHARRHLVRTTAGGTISSELRAMGNATQTERLEILMQAAIKTLESAARSGSGTVANHAVREIRGIIDSLAKTEAGGKGGRCQSCRQRAAEAVNAMSETHFDIVRTFMNFLPRDVRSALASQIHPIDNDISRNTIVELRDFLSAVIDDPANWDSDGDPIRAAGSLVARWPTTAPGTPYRCARRDELTG